MTTVSIEEAQARLPDLIAALRPGETLVIVARDRPVARLTAEPSSEQSVERGARRPGGARGILRVIEEDDDHLADFGEYMP